MSGAALRFLQASSWMRRKNRPSAREQASLPRPVAAKARRCLRQKQPSWSRGRGLNFQAHCMRAGNSGHRNPDRAKRGAACGRNSRAEVGAAVQIYERAATCDGNLANSNQRGRGLNFQAHCMRARNSGHRNPDGAKRGAACGRNSRATTKARRCLRQKQPSWSWGSCPNLRARCDARWKFG